MNHEEAEKYLERLGWEYFSYGSVNAIVRGFLPTTRGNAKILAMMGYPIERHHMGRVKEHKKLIFFAPKNIVEKPLTVKE